MGYITIAERKGMEEGLKKGRKEGIQKGKLEGLRKAIESVLEVKFNTVDADIANHLKKIKSVNKLEELLHQAKLTTSLAQFKEILQNKN